MMQAALVTLLPPVWSPPPLRAFVEPAPYSMFLRVRTILTPLDSYDVIDPTSMYALLSVYTLRQLLDGFKKYSKRKKKENTRKILFMAGVMITFF